ncbi:hypothetical protein [Ornithinimicrobium kibberense]
MAPACRRRRAGSHREAGPSPVGRRAVLSRGACARPPRSRRAARAAAAG